MGCTIPRIVTLLLRTFLAEMLPAIQSPNLICV
jgi:hypothetical protein